MKNSLKQQSGITFMGLCFVLAFIAIVVIFTLRLFPLYNEKFQIEAAMRSVVSQPNAAKKTIVDTRKDFLKALSVTNINRFTDQTVKEYVMVDKPTKKGEPSMLHVKYNATNALFSDIQLLMAFDKKIPMGGAGADGE